MRAHVKITPDEIKPDTKWVLEQGLDTIGVVERYDWPAGSRFTNTPFELWTPSYRSGQPAPRFSTLDEAVEAADRIAEERARTSTLEPYVAYRETYRGAEFTLTRVPAAAGEKWRRFAHFVITCNGARLDAPQGDMERVAAKVRKTINLQHADEEVQEQLAAIVDARPNVEGMPGWDDGAAPKVGDTAYVHARGMYRRGLVVGVTKARATVAYVTRSNPGRVHRKADRHSELAAG
ncbi:hypothetical protein [Streptomyces sp. NBC_01789]|uniref:hypothetical protein n=1 Tax=Streptomyces sp. NBC_01789 TaxID=2975941 RepID=UPI00225BB022|nr:hypothetical protein [Streptomyces sp. NBC_01789]MCX4451698.1 hypothetical protein [Streptomyces sp. NBC_01789]